MRPSHEGLVALYIVLAIAGTLYLTGCSSLSSSNDNWSWPTDLSTKGHYNDTN